MWDAASSRREHQSPFHQSVFLSPRGLMGGRTLANWCLPSSRPRPALILSQATPSCGRGRTRGSKTCVDGRQRLRPLLFRLWTRCPAVDTLEHALRIREDWGETLFLETSCERLVSWTGFQPGRGSFLCALGAQFILLLRSIF